MSWVESCTLICSERAEDAGETNNWRDPAGNRTPERALRGVDAGPHVVPRPVQHGAARFGNSMIGVKITDSGYVALSKRIMTGMRGGRAAHAGRGRAFVRCAHSLAWPWPTDGRTCRGPAPREMDCHYLDISKIWSDGSGCGGKALLSKNCLTLRIASVVPQDQGWLAEHMLILKLTGSTGHPHVNTAAFPSARGTTTCDAAGHGPGLDRRDERRRHCLDAFRQRWPALCREPGSGGSSA